MWLNRKKRVLIGLGGIVAAVAIACGSSATATPAPAPAATAPPRAATATPRPTTPPATVAPTPVPTSPPAVVAPTQPPSAAAAPTPAPAAGQVAPAAVTFAWQIEQVDRGTKPALALTSGDVPFVAYMLEDSRGWVKNAIRGASTWDVATVAQGYFYGPLDLAIGPDDVAHISYHDHQDPGGFRPDKGDAIHAAFQGGKWTATPVFSPGHDGWDNRLIVDPQGRPHISAIDPVDFGGKGVEYYHLDQSGAWQVEAVPSGAITYMFATAIALDPQGNPHITFFDGSKLALASKGASGWTVATVDGARDAGLFSSLVIDREGRFHISYLQRTSASSGVVKYATRGPGDAAWKISEVDKLDRLSFGFVGARNITSLVLDGQGNPWIAYSDEKKLNLAIWDGSAWQRQTVQDAGARTLGQLVSLKLDSKGQPHIAFFEVTSQGPLQGLVKYAKGTPR